MAAGSQRRTRLERVAALELPPGRWEQRWLQLHRPAVLVRIGLGLAAAIVIGVATFGWDPPFAYRRGQPVPRDVVSRATFDTVNATATRDARVLARRQSRPVYVHDPQPLNQELESLFLSVREVVAKESESDVHAWSDFLPRNEADPEGELSATYFSRFHGALVAEKDRAEFERAVRAALRPMRETGLLGGRALRLSSAQGGEIDVYPVVRLAEAKPVTVGLSSVRLGDGASLRRSLNAHLKENESLVEPVWNWLRNRLAEVSTLSEDSKETGKASDAAEAAVDDIVATFQPGAILAVGGKRLGHDHIAILLREHETVVAGRSVWQRLQRAAAVVGLIAWLFGLVAAYLYGRERRLLASLPGLSGILLLLCGTVLAATWLSVDMLRAEIVPLLLFAMAVAIAYRREVALVLTGTAVLITAMATGFGLSSIVVGMGVVLAVVLQLERIRSRTKLIYVALGASSVALALTVAMAVLDSEPLDRALWIVAGCNAWWTVFAGFVMTLALPFIERMQWFGVLTDISLLELGDVSHPLLQQLVQRAPSTYNHSITVGSLAEAAAEAIGARGLLARIGAYYHDIGKMLKPGYFSENQSESGNRHESLAPAMSTLVIIAHVKDGSDLARQHGLPQPIVDMIEQHHGTTLVEYFYNRANEQFRQSEPNGAEVDESLYRYPGLRPQTKEAAVLMLADSIESAARSLVDPAPARIESLVREIADRKLDDGQFDETNLTLCDLRTVEDSIIKSLIANYHSRVKYPDQKTA